MHIKRHVLTPFQVMWVKLENSKKYFYDIIILEVHWIALAFLSVLDCFFVNPLIRSFSSLVSIVYDHFYPSTFYFSKELMSKFPVRNLVALSVHPLLVYPTHYVGDSGYVSDTEDTVTVFKENATANNATDNTTAEVNNEKEGSIAERRFEQRRTTSQLQGDL